MKIGFELFKTRPTEDSLDLNKLELDYGIKLPPLYKLFLRNFYPKIYLDLYMDNQHNEKYNLLWNEFSLNNHVMLDDFLEIESTLRGWNEKGYYDQLYEWKFLPIANTQTRYKFCVGLEGNMRDKIILDFDSFDSEFEVVASDIFEFIRTLKYVQFDRLRNKVQYSQLYKNWGEDLWRIKE